MSGTFEIYTIGGGFYLSTVFNYLAAFTASTDFKLFMSIGIMIGSLGIAWQMLWGAGLRDILSSIVLMMLVGLGGMGIKARVVIIDPASGTIPIYGTVDNVPWAVAFVAHLTTETSYFLTQRMETLLAAPDNLSYQRSGMLFGATLLSQAANWRAISPKIHELLVNYAQGCIIDATLLGHMELEDVTHTGSMETYVGANMPQSLAYYDPVTAQTQTCAERWTAVKGLLNTEVETVIMTKAAAAFPSSRDTGQQNTAKIKGTLSDFQYMIGMSSTSAVQTIRQAMWLTAMDDSLQRFIASSGNDAAMALYQKARTDVQTKASYSAIGASALKWVPLLKIALETVYYGAFPLALFMMLTPMGMSVLKGYFGGYVWLASWGPISALLHWIVLESSAGYYRSAGVTTTNGAVNDVVLSLSNLYQVQAVEADVGSVAGYLMMSVPFLATALVFGANKMTSMATSLLNVGQGAAIETGREAATGSLSLGNVSMNNMAANKWNTSAVVDSGRYTGFRGNGASFTRNADGSVTYGKGSAVSEFANTAMADEGMRSELSARAETSKTAATNASREFTSWLSGATSENLSFVSAVTSSSGSGETGSSDMSNSLKTEVANSWSLVEDFAKQNNVSSSVAMQAALAGRAGLEGGMPDKLAELSPVDPKLSGDLTGQTSAAAANEDVATLAQKASQDDKLMAAVDSIDSARLSTNWNTGQSESQSSDQSRRLSLDEGQRLASTMVRSISEAETAANGLAYYESTAVQGSANLIGAVADNIAAKGYDPAVVLNSSTPENIGIFNQSVREVADSLTLQGAGVAQEGLRAGQARVESFSLDDPSVQTSIPAPDPSATANLGGVTIDPGAMRDSAQRGFTQTRSSVDAEFATHDNTERSNNLRDDFRTRKRETLEAADESMMWRMGSKVVSSTAGLLGITDSQASWLLQNDPDLRMNTQDRIMYYRENYDEMKAKLATAPLVGPDGSPAPTPSAPPPAAPAAPPAQPAAPATTVQPSALRGRDGAGEATLQDAAFHPGSDLVERAADVLPPGTRPLDLARPVEGYSAPERDQMIRAMLTTSPSLSPGQLIGTALAMKDGNLATPAKLSAIDENSRAYQQAAFAADLVMSGSVTEVPEQFRNDNYLMLPGGAQLSALIVETAQALGTTPLDLATAISYETGGTFNPTQPGPVTQWGRHQGFIQFGEPQAAQYGADFSSREAAIASQLGADGAVVHYLRDHGFQPGMSFADLYSTINAGAPGRYNASDAQNGGAPGTVMDKVNSDDMAAHRAKAAALLGLTAGGQDA